jgi:hypothetical protein
MMVLGCSFCLSSTTQRKATILTMATKCDLRTPRAVNLPRYDPFPVDIFWLLFALTINIPKKTINILSSYLYSLIRYDLHIPTYLPTYIHTYIHTHIHTWIHTRIPTCLPTYLHAYMQTYILSYIPAYIHTCRYIHPLYIYIYTHAHTYVHIYIHTHAGLLLLHR